MKETGKVFGVLQRVGRAFMLPIAVLPVAGLLLGIGRSLTNETMLRAYHLMKIMGPGTILYGVIKVGSDCGSIIFDNLPLIFAVSTKNSSYKNDKKNIDQWISYGRLWRYIGKHGIYSSMGNEAGNCKNKRPVKETKDFLSKFP